MTKDRVKYNNKLIKQLKAAGINVDESSGLVVSSEQETKISNNSDYYFDHTPEGKLNLKMENNLVDLANETLNALTEQKDVSEEDILSDWDPMKDSYEQKSFNSYQEPSYNADVMERHNPVRGTRISPAKGSEDEVTLFVSNIPIILNEDAIRNLFKQYGKVKRVTKCRPKIIGSETTFGFVSYVHVREASEAIANLNDFDFGLEKNLRVRLSHGKKDDGMNFVPQNIDIKLGGDYKPIKKTINEDSGNDSLVEKGNTPPKQSELKKTNDDPLFKNMFTETTTSKPPQSRSQGFVPDGPRLYIQGISTRLNQDDLQRIIGEIAPCKDPVLTSAKSPGQFTTFGFVTVGSIEDADMVINHFDDFRGKLKASYSNKSAKDFNKPLASNADDDFYLNLLKEPSLEAAFGEDVVKEPIIEPTHEKIIKKKELPIGNIKGLSTLVNVLDASKTSQPKENQSVKARTPSPILKPIHEPGSAVVATVEKSPSPVKETVETPSQFSESVHYSGEEKEVSVESLMKLLDPESSPAKPKAEEKKTELKQIPKTVEEQTLTDFKNISFEREDIDQPSQISFPEEKDKDQELPRTLKEECPPTPTPKLPNETSFIPSKIPQNINPLEMVSSRMEVQKLYSDSYDAIITNVESPSLIYGVLVNKDGTQKIDSLTDEIAATFDRRKDLVFTFQSGCLCTVQDNDAWRRALIIKIDKDDVEIFLIDFGKQLNFKKEQIRPLLKEHKMMPAQALPMKLITAVPKEGSQWTEDSTKFLQRILTNCKVRIRPEYKDKMVFGVRLKIGTQSIDKLLEDKGFAKQIMCELPQIMHDWKPVQLKEINTNDISWEKLARSEFEVYVSHVDSPSKFCCRLFEKSKDLKVDEIEWELKNLYGNKDISEVSIYPKMTCAFKLENGKWHRGLVLKKLVQEKLLVLAIDYGKTHTIPSSSIYPLPEKLKEFPAQALSMQLQYVIPIDGGQHFSNATCDRFKQLTFGRVMIARVVNVYNTFYREMCRVLLFDKKTGCNVGDKLVEEEYAKKFSFPKQSTGYQSTSDSPCKSPDKLQSPGGVTQETIPAFGRGRVLGRGLTLIKDRGLLKP